MKQGGGSQSTIIIGPSKSVLVYALHSLEYVLGFVRFRVFVPKFFTTILTLAILEFYGISALIFNDIFASIDTTTCFQKYPLKLYFKCVFADNLKMCGLSKLDSIKLLKLCVNLKWTVLISLISLINTF